MDLSVKPCDQAIKLPAIIRGNEAWRGQNGYAG